MTIQSKHITRTRKMQWTAMTLISLLTVGAQGGGIAPPPLPTEMPPEAPTDPYPQTPRADEEEDLLLLLLLIEIICALLGCEEGDPLLPEAGAGMQLASVASIESSMSTQIDFFNAWGPPPDLTPAQRVTGRGDCAETRSFLLDHPGLVNESLAGSYRSMLTELINAL